MNEPKKSTLAKTQLGWRIDRTRSAEAPYAHLLEPAARGSAPDQLDQHHVQVQPDYVQQANAQQQQVQQYTEDPYIALAAQYGQPAQPPKTNANVQPRRPKGSTPPPRRQKATSQPLFNDPTKPHSYNMASYVGEYDGEPATVPQQAQFHAQAYHAYNSAEHAATQPPAVAPISHAAQYTPAQYAQQAQQADHAAQHAQQDYAAYAAQLQAYAAQQEAYAQQYAQQQYAQQQYAQQQYAQQDAHAQQQYAQQQYAQQYVHQDAHAQQYAQQQYAYAQQYQQTNDGYAQANHAAYPQPQSSHDAANPYAAQYQQQVAAYEQQQRESQAPGNALGGIAAKLQQRAEKVMKGQKGQKGQDDNARDQKIPGAVATAGSNTRRDFVKKTYRTLFFAILAFAGLLWAFRTIEPLRELLQPFVNFSLGGRWNWGVVLAAFMGTSFLAEIWSHAKSRKVQYMGLGFYVLAEALIFVPLMAVVEFKTASIVAGGGGEPHIVRDAAFMTLAVFGMLTASVVFSKKDFSFLRSALFMASGVAVTLVVLSLMFGFGLGLIFSAAMVVLAGGYILYHTSQVLAHHDPDAHVAAALDLFSSVALMFWYLIRIFMRARD